MKNIALYAITVLLLIGCESKNKHEGHDKNAPKVYYTCSMDPQVMETKPGKCPICKMELTPITVDQLQSDGIKLSDEQVRLANIKTQVVALGYIEQEVFATGTVKENENSVHFINSRIDGRIDKLNFKTKGASINKGEIIYEIYSEMLASTQSEFINTWKLLALNPKDILLNTVYQSAYTKLLLWGITEAQIEQLKSLDKPLLPYPIVSTVSGVIRAVRISEGATVMEGQPLFELTGYTSLWVDAQFYPNETVQIRPGNKIDVFIEGLSGEAIKGSVVQILPQVSPSSTITIVRILITPTNSLVRPGMQANIAWHKEGEKTLIIPSNAILREASGNTVWIRNKQGIYEPKMVHIGEVSGSRVEILHGIEDGDEVVVSGSYLLQSEYVFKKGNNPMAGHDM